MTTTQYMGLLTWLILAIIILSIIGQGWNLFVSSVFRGIDKVLNGISPIATDLGNEAKKYANNITKAVPADFGNNV
jgi:multisubunit Na+/H+ antiporter MnhC subunit